MKFLNFQLQSEIKIMYWWLPSPIENSKYFNILHIVFNDICSIVRGS